MSNFIPKYQKFHLKKNFIQPYQYLLSPTRSRKADLIESLAKSPETSRVLARRGLILSKAEKNEVNRTIVDSMKESFSVLQSSTGNGTIRQKARTICRAGIKMATLKSKSKKAIGKVSKRLELRQATVSNILKSFEASPDPSS